MPGDPCERPSIAPRLPQSREEGMTEGIEHPSAQRLVFRVVLCVPLFDSGLADGYTAVGKGLTNNPNFSFKTATAKDLNAAGASITLFAAAEGMSELPGLAKLADAFGFQGELAIAD